MSFLKITNPDERDAIVEDYIKTKKRIRENDLRDKTIQLESKSELLRTTKPITEALSSVSKNITDELLSLKEGITLPQQLAIQEVIPQVDKPLMLQQAQRELLGPLAKEYLSSSLSNVNDPTFGIHGRGSKCYIGNSEVNFDGDNLIIGGRPYEGTRGLWELIQMKNPNHEVSTDEDLQNYETIILDSDVLHAESDPNNRRPRSSRSEKWNTILKPMWERWRDSTKKKGKGINSLPCDANALVNRLDLLMSSKAAGNTGLRNEIIDICDELKRRNMIEDNQYKQLMLTLTPR